MRKIELTAGKRVSSFFLMLWRKKRAVGERTQTKPRLDLVFIMGRRTERAKEVEEAKWESFVFLLLV